MGFSSNQIRFTYEVDDESFWIFYQLHYLFFNIAINIFEGELYCIIESSNIVRLALSENCYDTGDSCHGIISEIFLLYVMFPAHPRYIDCKVCYDSSEAHIEAEQPDVLNTKAHYVSSKTHLQPLNQDVLNIKVYYVSSTNNIDPKNLNMLNRKVRYVF